MRDAKLKKELNATGVEIDSKLLVDAEAEERELLSGVAQVQSRLFEGKVVQNQGNKEIAEEWRELQKRARVDRIVMIDQGATLATGTPAEIQRDEKVREAYLGRDE